MNENSKSKIWQIGFFTLNNTATNIYLFVLGFISYYATGIAGLVVITVSNILTAMRLWDGVTDPIIGFLIDKTDSKFGKFRPYMILGNVILAITTLILFKTTHKVPENIRLLYFVGVYVIYIIGYTFQTAVTKSGQTVLITDPKQRPTFTIFDTIYNTILFTGGQILVASYLVKKHDGFTLSFFNEFVMMGIVLSAICTCFAIIGIWEKDRTEYFLGSAQELKFKDYLSVIKGNKAIQMLIVAASTDKLAAQVASNPVVVVMLYGIVMGNYALSGKISMIMILPTVIISTIGMRFAVKIGQKNTMYIATWFSIVLYGLFLVFLNSANLQSISVDDFSKMNITTIIFILFMVLGKGSAAISGGIVIPMIADCSDYEVYKTGRFVPGMMGTIFSFVDKLISSLATTIIGFVVGFIGYSKEFPKVGDVATKEMFWATMFLFIGLPILGWIASVIALKYYPLDNKKMAEIKKVLDEKRIKDVK